MYDRWINVWFQSFLLLFMFPFYDITILRNVRGLHLHTKLCHLMRHTYLEYFSQVFLEMRIYLYCNGKMIIRNVNNLESVCVAGFLFKYSAFIAYHNHINSQNPHTKGSKKVTTIICFASLRNFYPYLFPLVWRVAWP